MRRLHFQRPNDLSKLQDELLAAIPALRPKRGEAVMGVEGLGDEIWLTVPDDADEAAIAAIVEVHDPTPEPAGPTPIEQLNNAIQAATGLGDIKQAFADWTVEHGQLFG